MKTIILLLLGITLCLQDNERMKQLVEKINKMNTTWKAKYYGDDFKMFLGVPEIYESKHINTNYQPPEINDLPRAFDLRKKYPNCPSLTTVLDQSKCDSSYAFASSSVMSDRICIESKGKSKPIISAQYIVSCGRYDTKGCRGGTVDGAFELWRKKGVYIII